MRKQILSFVLLAMLGTLAAAQEPVDYKSQYVQLYKAYTANPSDVATLVGLATYYTQPGNPQYSLPQAGMYIRRAEEIYSAWLDDDAKYDVVLKLIRQKITLQSIRQQRKEIRSMAMSYVQQHAASMDESELTAYAEGFSDVEEIVASVRSNLLRSAYHKVCRENTIAGYYAFALSHKGYAEADSAEAALARLAPRYYSIYNSEGAVDAAAEPYPESQAMQRAAMLQKSRIAYAEALRQNTINAYAAYMERYPKGSDYVNALMRMDELVAMEFGTLHTPEDYADFAENHSESDLADTALARLRAMVTENGDVNAAKVYLSRFPLDPEYTQIYRTYYSWHAAEGNGLPIEIFAKENPDYPYRVALEGDLERGRAVDTFDLTRRFVERDYEKMSSNIYKLTGKRIAYVALQRILQQQLARHDYNGAYARMQKFDLCFENEGHTEYSELAQLLTGPAAHSDVRPEFATEELDGAVWHPKNGQLYYNTLSGGIFYAKPNVHKWRWVTAGYVRLEGGSTGMKVCGFYPDGSRALLAFNGDIYTAEMISDTLWGRPEKLPSPVNTEYTECDATMLEDGSGMLLASDRPGGHNFQPSGSYFHGDSALATDLYFIPYSAAGWGEAVNLGPVVNTDCCERSPLLSRNMKTLYFITDAHGGLGYGDVYKCERTDIDDWTHWKKPVNLGRLVNGPFDESNICFVGSESRLLVTSDRAEGGKACKSCATQHDTASCYRMVTVDLSALTPPIRRIDVAEVGSQQVVQTFMGDELHEALKLRLNKGRDYALLVNSDNLLVPAMVVRGRSGSSLTLAGYTLGQLMQMKDPLPLTMVRFAKNTDRMLPLAEVELAQLAQFVKRNAVCMIELQVQVNGTDDKACYDLSVDRSLAIRSRLVEMGVNPDRIRISAYGNVSYKQGRNPAEVSVSLIMN